MALTVGHIIEIQDHQRLFSQQVLNVYHFRVVSSEANASLEQVAEQFESVFINQLQSIQSVELQHEKVVVRNLSDGVGIWEEADIYAGEVTGECMPSFVAYGFRLIRTDASTRHGQKRIAGVPESAISGNSLASGWAGGMTTTAGIIGGPLVQSGTVDFDFELEPVILGRYPTGHANQGEINLAVVNPVASAQFIRVTTQTTRKAGRGS